MQSHLSRYIFRQILCNEPFTHAQCSRSHILRSLVDKRPRASPSAVTVRFLWGFSRKPPRPVVTTSYDPGFDKLLEIKNALVVRARPPAPEQVGDALRQFFEAKSRSQTQPLAVQVEHALVALKYLQEIKGDDLTSILSLEDLQTILRVLKIYNGDVGGQPERQRENRTELAKLVYKILESQMLGLGSDRGMENFDSLVLHPYLQALANWGHTLDARNVLFDFLKQNPEQGKNPEHWRVLLRGFQKEKQEEELLKTISTMREKDIPFNARALSAILLMCAKQNDMQALKKWYGYSIDDGQYIAPRTKITVLEMCIAHREFEWGQPIFEELLDRNPSKETWDFILKWSAACGKGVDEVEQMMEVMIRRSKYVPDVKTFNGLIAWANDMNDPYSAERYAALGKQWKVDPDANTLILQMDYRLKVGDIAGARRAYKELQAYEVLDGKEAPLINRLILSLCKAEKQDYAVIMSYVEDLAERKARFEPEVVAALCQVYLARNELDEVIDLLQMHAFHYSLEQRARIRDTFVNFCLDSSIETARAWAAYTILRQVFMETDNATRTVLMKEFFDRGRTDMAIHVFGHMRQAAVREKRPTAETYTECFEGIAKHPDEESLKTVHNMLKLDTEVEPDTRLKNALMLAYMACGEPERSLEFWEDIIYSREGPSYNSICIALRACQTAPDGAKAAKEIWARLQRFEIEVTKDILVEYAGALAAQGLMDDSLALVDRMESLTGCRPEVDVIASLAKASIGDRHRTRLEAWARATHPTAWEELMSSGETTGSEGKHDLQREQQLRA